MAMEIPAHKISADRKSPDTLSEKSKHSVHLQFITKKPQHQRPKKFLPIFRTYFFICLH